MSEDHPIIPEKAAAMLPFPFLRHPLRRGILLVKQGGERLSCCRFN
jgi:hypothetical protein